MRYIEANSEPIFDLAYIDGSHSWFVDGFAFFLVDRLLRDGGWIIFDDMDWSFAKSKSSQILRRLNDMPEDERTTPQVRLIFELLVKRHPGYGNFREQGSWGFAQKLPATQA
jgi:predicted O-methyltransferase YrrM